MRKLTDRYRAALRLVVIGVTITEAAEIHGIPRPELSRMLHSVDGQAYVAHMRELCEHYTAAMCVLGLRPNDITRPGGRYKMPNPPANAATLRRAAGQAMRVRAGLPTGKQVDNDADKGSDGQA